MADEASADELRIKLADTDIKVYSGASGLCEMIADSKAETVLNSIIGEAGLMPTLTTIRSGKKLALANKESLVVAGETVMSEAKRYGVDIVPVDSEHFDIIVRLTISPVFLSWVATFGSDIEIISPDSVIDEYLALLKRATDKYINNEEKV